MDGTQLETSNPRFHYVRPGFKVLTPNEVETSNADVIYHWGGVKIVRLADQIAVKYGPSVKLAEAETLKFLSESSVSLPFPRLFASYVYTPAEPQPDDSDLLHTYIFLAYVPGETLEKVWTSLDVAQKFGICRELGAIVEELRSLPVPSYIGSVNEGPVLDNIVDLVEDKGPFRSVTSFHSTLANSYARIHKGQIFRYIQGLLGAGREHKVAFAHADLRRANIIVHNGKISGIIDWEMAGWYPEYWEFAKIFAIYRFQDDWGDNMLDNLQPYYAELAAYNYVSQFLW